jgi:hypothetical protein
MGLPLVFGTVSFAHLFSFLCCVFALFVLCLVCPMLPVSLDCPFLIALRVSLTFIYKLKKLITISEHLLSPMVFSGVRFVQDLVVCVVFCKSVFVLLFFFMLPNIMHVLQYKGEFAVVPTDKICGRGLS